MPEGKGDYSLDQLSAVEANLERARVSVAGNRPWSTMATRAYDFFEGRQWDEGERLARERAGRPHLTLNKTRRLVGIVLGIMSGQRQRPIVRPDNDMDSSDEVATILTRILNCENTDQRFDTLQRQVVKDGIIGGRGWLDVRVDFERNPFGAIHMRHVNPFTVLADPDAECDDTREWNHVIEARWHSLRSIMMSFAKLPADKAALLEQAAINRSGSASSEWHRDSFWYDSRMTPASYFGMVKLLDERGDMGGELARSSLLGGEGVEHVDKARKRLRVLECQSREWVRGKQWVDMISGRTWDVRSDMTPEQIKSTMLWAQQMGELKGTGMTLGLREGLFPRWRWTVTCGEELLYEDWSPYKWPTLTGFFPSFRGGVTQGMVEHLIDAQIEHNRNRSNAAEIMSKAAATGWMVPKGSLEPEEEAYFREYGSTPGFQLYYKPIAGLKPEPIVQPTAAQAFVQQAQLGEQDMLTISGINESTLGVIDDAQASGKAVMARQKQAALQVAEPIDAYVEFIQRVGERQVDIIRDWYTEERVFAERGEDGKDQRYVINERLASGAIVNDVTMGTYRVAVDAAPADKTLRDDGFEEATQLDQALLAKGVPGGLPADILIDLSNIPRKEEVRDRIAAAMALPMPVPGVPGQPPMPGAPPGAPPQPGMPPAPAGAPPIGPGGGAPPPQQQPAAPPPQPQQAA